ncbi:MAG: ATP-binding protein [Rhodospirillaceae bacterium]
MESVQTRPGPQPDKLIRLLLVDDDPADASFVEKVLSEGSAVDFSVHRVADLSSARQIARTDPFDMVILDLDLPDSQGMDTLAQVRAVVGEAVPIVVLGEADANGVSPTTVHGYEAEFLAKLNLDHRIVPRLLHHLLQRQRTETSLRQLIATFPDSMVVVNIDGIVLFANPAASDLFGRPIGDLINQQFGFPVVGDGAVEIEIGGRRIAEMRVVKINWLEQAAYLTSLREITQRKQMEEDLREAKIEAELSNLAKTHFLACMSHELRTPLNSIIGFSEIIQQDILQAQHDTYREYAEIINTSGKHLLSIVNDVLDVAAVEAGKVVLDCQIIDVHLAITSSLQMVSRIAREKGVDLLYQPIPYMVPLYADFRRLRQILINLLSNSVKYTQAGGQVTTSCYCDEDGSLVLLVEDTGIGISAEDLANLMKPFGRVGNPYTTRNQGTGLGLYITRVMAELHGGSLTISSEPNLGTTAIVRFPPKRVVPYRA